MAARTRTARAGTAARRRSSRSWKSSFRPTKGWAAPYQKRSTSAAGGAAGESTWLAMRVQGGDIAPGSTSLPEDLVGVTPQAALEAGRAPELAERLDGAGADRPAHVLAVPAEASQDLHRVL